MSSNKAIFQRFHEALNSRDAALIAATVDEVCHPDVIFHAPVPTGVTGTRALKEVWPVLLRGFPDIRVEVQDVIAEGDRLVSRHVVTGTHQGEFRGLPPTGRAVTYDEIFIFRFADGRIAELWGVVDVLTQLRQLGAVPS
ncbi:ester cyclase [Nonomuraea mesophila]|uniref:Ester cyclase n=1 Tax=Nonomuraea mesophila TaxID=2530382 RepID=A0A4R5FVQ0_9ACTN|nr:ester cyclase [Nonomuraea mesophila]TDE57983.1 ester cyclase [Nonomuraea mesophila]